jgi:hypothetical protein
MEPTRCTEMDNDKRSAFPQPADNGMRRRVFLRLSVLAPPRAFPARVRAVPSAAPAHPAGTRHKPQRFEFSVGDSCWMASRS